MWKHVLLTDGTGLLWCPWWCRNTCHCLNYTCWHGHYTYRLQKRHTETQFAVCCAPLSLKCQLSSITYADSCPHWSGHHSNRICSSHSAFQWWDLHISHKYSHWHMHCGHYTGMLWKTREMTDVRTSTITKVSIEKKKVSPCVRVCVWTLISIPGHWIKDQLYLFSWGHQLTFNKAWGAGTREGLEDEGAWRRVWIGPRYEPSMHCPRPVLLGSVHHPQPGWSKHCEHVRYPEQFSAVGTHMHR